MTPDDALRRALSTPPPRQDAKKRAGNKPTRAKKGRSNA